MKILTNRENLLNPLIHAGGVVERRQTLPILSNILINTHPDSLSITATDLEVELKTRADGSCDEERSFTLPARKLLDICKALPDAAAIDVTVEGEKAVLKSGRSRFTLGLLPAQDYPVIEPSMSIHRVEIEERAIKRLLDKTQFSMAQQDVRYYLNGMLLEADGEMLRTVATDGHRLAVSELAHSAEDTKFQVILPRKAVLEIAKLLHESDEKIQIELSNNHIRIYKAELVFTSKLIDGRFPDYQRVVPSDCDRRVRVDRASFRQALTRASILSNEKYRGIRVKVTEGLMELQAHNPEQEEAQDEIEVEYEGDELVIGFNVGYLLDVLSVVEEETIDIELRDANTSALIRGLADASSRYVIMPMRL